MKKLCKLDFDGKVVSEFKHFICNRREELGISREELADCIGVLPGTLRRMEENWKFIPDSTILLRLMYVLHISWVTVPFEFTDSSQMFSR